MFLLVSSDDSTKVHEGLIPAFWIDRIIVHQKTTETAEDAQLGLSDTAPGNVLGCIAKNIDGALAFSQYLIGAQCLSTLTKTYSA